MGRIGAAAAILAIVATACATDGPASAACPRGLGFWEEEACEPPALVDLDEIHPGGPGPDRIAPIDEPVYTSLEDAAGWLEEESPLLVTEVGDEVRAYPLAILTFHELVSDRVDGLPVAISYCPLCNSGVVFERTVLGPDGPEVLDFSTSGRLYRSNLVMYDRQHENLWSQFDGRAIVGERFLGTELTRIPSWQLGFAELTRLHPDARVLSRDTGFSRDYGRNPYHQYDSRDGEPFLLREAPDDRLEPMRRVVGIGEGTDAQAIPLDVLARHRTVHTELGARPIVVLWAPGQVSALDFRDVDNGRDVGQTAAFAAEVDGRAIDLEPTDQAGRFVDPQTGSRFDLAGRGLDGPLAGHALEPVPHDDTFWFAWASFEPDTAILDP